MPSTHLSLHYHLVFSTKERYPWIEAAWRARLHEFLGGCVRQLKGIPEAVGGTEDHVHLLVGLRATHTLADVLRDIKKASSNWVHDSVGKRIFQWQEGYGAFTVSAPMRATVVRYIRNQERHHRKLSFQDEYRDFLRKSGMAFKEEHLW